MRRSRNSGASKETRLRKRSLSGERGKREMNQKKLTYNRWDYFQLPSTVKVEVL